MPFTQAQTQAIEAPTNISLSISAGAGSGKTTVLVERILHLVAEGKELSRMLIVTFTRAAAASMRQKLQRALEERAATKDKDGWYRRALEQLVHTEISTLHAFCLNTLRRYYFLTDLPPDFSIIDDRRAALISKEALAETLEEAALRADENPLFAAALTPFLRGKGAGSLEEAVTAAALFLNAAPNAQKAAEDACGLYNLPLDANHPWVQAENARIGAVLKAVYDMGAEALSLLPENPPAGVEAAAREIMDISLAMQSTPLFAMPACLPARFCSLRAKALEFPEGERYKSTVTLLRASLREAGKSILAYAPFAQEDVALTGEAVKALCEVALSFLSRFRRARLAEGGVNFDDLEHETLSLLTREPQVSRELRLSYDAVFVDEYQDTNVLQDAIIELVSRGDNLFLVGDVKQSIYRFRRADPMLFNRRLSGPATRIDLSHNFRSHSGVLAGVNDIFERLMQGEAAEIHYDEAARLRPGAPWQEESAPCPCETQSGFLGCACSRTEALVLLKEGAVLEEGAEEAEEGSPENLAELTAREAEANLAADRIEALLAQSFYDPAKKEVRRVTFRDIVLLSRNEKSVVPTYLEVFARRGLPLFAQPAGGFFDRYEVALVLDYLRVILNREDDVSLLGVLLSHFGGFTASELAALRVKNPKGPLYGCLVNPTPELFMRAENLRLHMERFGRLARSRELETFLWQFYDETGFLHYVSTLPGGAGRAENLRLLARRAGQYDADYQRGVAGFVQFAAALKEAGGQFKPALAENEEDNVLRFMSIHKSKGLEFPFVLLVECGASLEGRGKAGIAANSRLGIGAEAVIEDNCRFTRRPTLPMLAIREENRRKDRAESLRLLYVAATRAAHKLIFIGRATEKALAAPPDRLLLGNSFYAWLLPILPELRIKSYFLPRGGASEGVTEEKTAHAARLREGNFTEEELAWKGRLQERFSWRYPYPAATELPVKEAVTSLAGDIRLLRPPGAEEQKALLAGNAAHTFMQRVRHGRPAAEEAARLAAEGYLTEEEAALLPISGIQTLLESPVFALMQKARRVEKEAPFCAPYQKTQGMFTILQGKIDCYFETEEGLHILDYKLTRFKNAEEAAVHFPQLALYARALSDMAGKPIVGAYICSLATGAVYPAPPEALMRAEEANIAPEL